MKLTTWSSKRIAVLLQQIFGMIDLVQSLRRVDIGISQLNILLAMRDRIWTQNLLSLYRKSNKTTAFSIVKLILWKLENETKFNQFF